MSTSPPPGTSANDDERARWGDTLPDVGAAPRNDPNATEVPVRPPPPAPPPIYGRPPPPSAWPPAQPPPAPPSASPTAPYQPVSPPPYGGAPPPTPYPDPNAPTGYGGYPPQTPPGYGGTQPLPQPDAPPYYGGYPPQAGGYGTQPVYLPPAAPPPKKRGGLIAGIIAAVVAIVLIAAGVFFATNKGGGTSATATPRLTVVSGVPAATATTTASARGVTAVPTQARIGNLQGTLAAAATGTSGAGASLGGPAATPTVAATPAAPTRAAATATRAVSGSASAATASRSAGSVTVGQGGLPPTPTGSARPGTAAATSSVTLGQTWTDPSGRLKLQYPNGWTVTKATNAQTNLVEIDSPDGASFFVDVDQMTGTPDEELQTTRDARASSNQYTFAFSPTTDTKIGGEAGKVFSYTAKQRNQPNSTSIDGILWVVNHGGEEYDFEVIATGRHRADIEAILATVVFL